jgi:predicted MPP superfamily phosphohydrolase
MFTLAMQEPVVRRASMGMPDWPAGMKPIRIAFLSDIHVAGPDMPPSRLRRIVGQVNALGPDVILFGGDFVSDKRPATRQYGAFEALAPLAQLQARSGKIAVLGNHDHWRNAGAITRALEATGVRVLTNQAVSAGPLRIGGVDDDFTGRARLGQTVAAMDASPGANLLLSHSPDVAPNAPAHITLILAGHTHCGQIRLPVIGAVSYMSAYGERYACGLVVEGPRRVITSAGLGTSVLPFRLGAPPEVWLLTLGPARAKDRI